MTYCDICLVCGVMASSRGPTRANELAAPCCSMSQIDDVRPDQLFLGVQQRAGKLQFDPGAWHSESAPAYVSLLSLEKASYRAHLDQPDGRGAW